jgi:hypothetical protein
MAFTITPDPQDPWEINPDNLKHSYFVQLSPDRKHLVPGMLKQDSQPANTNWLDVTKIDRDFPKRYFVQQTDFNTLVPGSLIQANRRPRGLWKEVQKPRSRFHRVVFDDPYYSLFFVFAGDTTVSIYDINTQDQFITERVTPALAALYPQIPEYTTSDLLFKLPYAKYIFFNLYYFKGTFSDLNSDVTKLIPFSSANQLYMANSANIPQPGTHISAWMITVNSLKLKSNVPDGAYCFVLELLNVSKLVKEYVVLENVWVKSSIIMPPLEL